VFHILNVKSFHILKITSALKFIKRFSRNICVQEYSAALLLHILSNVMSTGIISGAYVQHRSVMCHISAVYDQSRKVPNSNVNNSLLCLFHPFDTAIKKTI